ncbi:MAG: hypothetical protein ACOYK9_04420 [Chlamydiia bacterium]
MQVTEISTNLAGSEGVSGLPNISSGFIDAKISGVANRSFQNSGNQESPSLRKKIIQKIVENTLLFAIAIGATFIAKAILSSKYMVDFSFVRKAYIRAINSYQADLYDPFKKIFSDRIMPSILEKGVVDCKKLAERFLKIRRTDAPLIRYYMSAHSFGAHLNPDLYRYEGLYVPDAILLTIIFMLKMDKVPDLSSVDDLRVYLETALNRLDATQKLVIRPLLELYASIEYYPWVVHNFENLDSLTLMTNLDPQFSHQQISGNCALKNLNQSLRYVNKDPFCLFYIGSSGGDQGHGTYLQVRKSPNGGFFALHHNLGDGINYHKRSSEGGVYPNLLYFKNKEELIAFIPSNPIDHEEFIERMYTNNSYLIQQKESLDEVFLGNKEDLELAKKWLDGVEGSKTQKRNESMLALRKDQRKLSKELIFSVKGKEIIEKEASMLKGNQDKRGLMFYFREG